jgi:Glycosyl hydrolase family 26
MTLSRRSLLAALPLAAAVTAATGASSATRATAATTAGSASWISGVCDSDPEGFGAWRGSPVAIAGMFADTSLAVQLEQWQYTHSTFGGDVDLAVGGPIACTWAQAAAGAELAHWRQVAAVLRESWHSRTVYLRFAHEFNGYWMKWSVAPAQLAAFRATFRLFASTMRKELAGLDVKIVFAPNFGTWRYTPDAAWPGSDVVDVVGLSIYEWGQYDTSARWQAFLGSSIGPNIWSAYARRHGRPLAFSEWGARSAYFVRAMHAWMQVMAGTGPGRLLYDVYLNDQQLALTGSAAEQYRALTWGY